jgi:hypothetical protein
MTDLEVIKAAQELSFVNEENTIVCCCGNIDAVRNLRLIVICPRGSDSFSTTTCAAHSV